MAASSVPYLTFKFGKLTFTIPRYAIIILFVCLALFIGYCHRNVVSTTKLVIAHHYNWSQFMESQFIASYYYGYILPQLLIGIACQLWGGKWILAVGIGMSAVFTFIAPFISSIFPVLIIDRVLTGLFQGAALPATTALYARWIPDERYSLATGIQYSGMYLGTAFTNGIYSTIRDAWGWEGNYYFFGILGFIWLLTFIVFAKSGPEDYDLNETARFIRYEHHDAENKQDIHDQRYDLGAHKHPPTMKFIGKLYLKLMVTQPSVVLFICHFCSNWSMYLLMGYVPTFIVCILGLDTQLVAFFGFLPYLLLYIVLLIASFSADALIQKRILSKTNVRKLMTTLGFGLPCACLFGVAFITSQVGGAILLVFAVACSGIAIPGFFPLPLDISHNYAGLIISLSNTLATIPGIVAPLFTGAMLSNGNCKSNSSDGNNPDCRRSWQIVLLVSACVYILGIAVMLIFGKAEEVDWDELVTKQKSSSYGEDVALSSPSAKDSPEGGEISDDSTVDVKVEHI